MTAMDQTSRSTMNTVKKHLENFASGDIDRIMTVYADGAVLATPEKVYRGTDEIRGLFLQLIDLFAGPDTEFDLLSEVYSGSLGTIVWSAKTASVAFEKATDSFVVTNDKIVNQTAVAFPDKV